MQREEVIDEASLRRVLAAVYEGDPMVSQAYSLFEKDLLSFPTINDLEAHIASEREAGRPWINLVLQYPEANGLVFKNKIELRPEHCGGATFRYSMEGWGLIQLQIDYKDSPSIKCRFAVNSEKRALAWAKTLPHLGDPHRREWKAIERKVRRLIRVLRYAPNPSTPSGARQFER